MICFLLGFFYFLVDEFLEFEEYVEFEREEFREVVDLGRFGMGCSLGGYEDSEGGEGLVYSYSSL